LLVISTTPFHHSLESLANGFSELFFSGKLFSLENNNFSPHQIYPGFLHSTLRFSINKNLNNSSRTFWEEVMKSDKGEEKYFWALMW